MFILDFVGEPSFEEYGLLLVQIVCEHVSSVYSRRKGSLTRVGGEDGRLATKGTIMLLIVLHNNQAADAEGMPAAEFYGPPFDFEAHGTRVIVQLRDMRQNLVIDLGADGLCKMLREFGILDLARKRRLDTESSTLIEFYRVSADRAFGKAKQAVLGYILFKIFNMAL